MTITTVKSRLDVIEDHCPCKAACETLIVMLPGAYDTPADFVTHGFVETLRARHIAADMLMVDTHVAYYTSASVVERLQQDVVLPARMRGYRHVWLVGISLGGYGSLLYSKQYGEQIAGLFLMAPFLGNRSLIAEVRKTGLTEWDAGEGVEIDDERKLWSWLQGYAGMFVPRPPLYLGYGSSDRFTGSNRLIEAVLPPDRIFTTDGGHEWPVWRVLWEAFLDSDALPRCEHA